MIDIDPFGEAVQDFLTTREPSFIDVKMDLAEDEQLPVQYLLRDYSDMPSLERKALHWCSGDILEVGCGAGSHALILQNRDFNVKAIDISPQLCQAARQRGVKECEVADIFSYNGPKVDTILMLMNGIGLSGTLDGAKKLLTHMKTLLNSGGSLIFDSSDIVYLYMNEDGSADIDIASNKYYGEVEYTLGYKGAFAKPFSWLFLDRDSMEQLAEECGYKVQMVIDGEHYDYLCKLTVL